MNFENSQNQSEILEKPKTNEIESNDIETVEDGEISPEAVAAISRADHNIAEITAMTPEEMTNDPEKLAKASDGIEKAKDWALRIASALTVAGSWGAAISLDIWNKAELLRSDEIVSMSSPEGIAGTLAIVTPVLAAAALGYRAYKKWANNYDAEQAAKAAQKSASEQAA